MKGIRRSGQLGGQVKDVSEDVTDEDWMERERRTRFGVLRDDAEFSHITDDFGVGSSVLFPEILVKLAVYGWATVGARYGVQGDGGVLNLKTASGGGHVY